MNRPLLVIAMLVPTAVFAQPGPPDGLPQYAPGWAGHDPGFITMDRFDASSRFGLEASYLFPNHTDGADVTSLRFDLHGQWVDPYTGAGAYIQVPFSYLGTTQNSDDGPATSNSTTAIGDVEVGGLFLAVRQRNVALVLRGGITLPTAPTSQDGSQSNLIAGYMRLTDIYLAVPDAVTVRASASLLVRNGQLFARADLGVDVNASAGQGVDADSFVHANVGVGVELGGVALMAESVNVYDTSSEITSGGLGASWIDTGAVSIRFRNRGLQPYAALVFPLDHDSNQFMSAALTLGFDTSLR
jgi:hypothetical protein